jgi:hypothetical protein
MDELCNQNENVQMMLRNSWSDVFLGVSETLDGKCSSEPHLRDPTARASRDTTWASRESLFENAPVEKAMDLPPRLLPDQGIELGLRQITDVDQIAHLER